MDENKELEQLYTDTMWDGDNSKEKLARIDDLTMFLGVDAAYKVRQNVEDKLDGRLLDERASGEAEVYKLW